MSYNWSVLQRWGFFSSFVFVWIKLANSHFECILKKYHANHVLSAINAYIKNLKAVNDLVTHPGVGKGRHPFFLPVNKNVAIFY